MNSELNNSGYTYNFSLYIVLSVDESDQMHAFLPLTEPICKIHLRRFNILMLPACRYDSKWPCVQYVQKEPTCWMKVAILILTPSPLGVC